MYKFIFILLLISFIELKSQNTEICFPYDSTVNIDGKFDLIEWQNSDSIIIGSNNLTNIYFKHDSSNLYFAFVGNLQSASRIPEIIIDTDNGKETSWQSDDWWFHVSATDCEFQGQYGNYDNCELVRPNWLAEKNIAEGPPKPPYIDTIEIGIPLITLDIDISDTIGISILLTNIFSTWEHWPTEANRFNPNTWGTAIFNCESQSNNIINKKPYSSIKVYPNPSQGQLHIKFSELQYIKEYSIKIINNSGKILQTIDNINDNLGVINLNIDYITDGIYFVIIENNEIQYKEKFIIKK